MQKMGGGKMQEKIKKRPPTFVDSLSVIVAKATI